nr:unnamed protein product [Callosobruchus analis]
MVAERGILLTGHYEWRN